MNVYVKMGIVVVLMTVVGMVVVLKHGGASSCCSTPIPLQEPTTGTEQGTVVKSSGLPRLVDLGAGKCIPCKMMKPILDELHQDYKDSFQVVFIDVWEKPDEAKPYNINLIPTQIFYDASGKELFRHEGFFAKEEILAKWKELGFELKSTQAPQ